MIATLPALEVPRPDWPEEAVVVGPLHFEPTDRVLEIPAGSGPVVVIAPSTASTGTTGLAELALECLTPGTTLPAGSRLVVSRLGGEDLTVPPWAVVGLGLTLGLEPSALAGVAASLLAGTPALTLLGAIGAALTAGLRRGGLLMAVLILPLTVPVLIFGVAAAAAASGGTVPFHTPFLILCALSLISMRSFRPLASRLARAAR